MSSITCKFGGTSLATVEAIRNVEKILDSDPNRRFVVPSAPGKRSPDDTKVTDLLYAWYDLASRGLDGEQMVSRIQDRYAELARGLGISFDIAKHLDIISAGIENYATPDYLASRGEHLMGHLMAELLGATFVEPADTIKFDSEGKIDPRTYGLLAAAFPESGRVVVPGYYGSTASGEVKTMSRGGSDVTGSIVARASRSSLYENWTDVSGFRMADPTVVPDAKQIEEITYRELRELSYMGASVLHDEAIFPVIEPGIPISIRNTRDVDAPGTMIVAKRKSNAPVIGIAGRGGFTMINIEKTLMNKERGFAMRVLSVLDHNDISFEHMPTGIDTISIIIKDEELRDRGPAIIKEIQRACDPNHVELTPRLAIIATVGQGMNHHVGVAARLCTALANASVNLRVIDQGSSEMNIIVGVEEADLKKSVRAIYDAFVSWE